MCANTQDWLRENEIVCVCVNDEMIVTMECPVQIILRGYLGEFLWKDMTINLFPLFLLFIIFY